MNIVIVGFNGRMNIALRTAAEKSRGEHVIGGIIRQNKTSGGGSHFTQAMTTGPNRTVCIDFSSPKALDYTLKFCLKAHVPLVLGTTPLTHGKLAQVERASRFIPIVCSPNFSIGMNLLRKAIPSIRGCDTAIVETHRDGKSKPSGTAADLQEVVRWSTAKKPEISSIRIGDAIGTHEVIFRFPFECFTLKHEAFSREAFVQGALMAAEFALGHTAGMFSMNSVLDGPIALPASA